MPETTPGGTQPSGAPDGCHHEVPGLNPAQARALAVALRLLEERLAIVDGILDHEDRGALYERPRLQVSGPRRARIEAMVAELRARIEALAQTYDLEREHTIPARKIGGLLSISWESLGNVGSRGLVAYGPVHPALGETLDPALEAIMALVTDLEHAVIDRGANTHRARLNDSDPERAK